MPHVSTAQRRTLDFRRFFQAQLATTAFIVMLAGGVSGSQAAFSALMGGVVSIVPAVYFVWRGMRRTSSRQSKQKILNFYQAAAGKFGLTVALFAIVLAAAPPSNPAFFFVAYVVAQLMHWLAPWLVRERPTP